MNELTITRPDDWHLHLRDNEFLTQTVPASARYFGRAIIMPNLVPPVTTMEDAIAYKARISKATPSGSSFKPLMTLYLTDNTSPKDIQNAVDSGVVVACKLYPAGATTNSDSGVTNIGKIKPTLEKMAEVGLPLLIHGEVTTDDIDIFDREKVFVESTLEPLVESIPTLKIVVEHITTKQAVEFVMNAPERVAATITPHHLLYNRNHMLVGGIRPHFYCLPILKRNEHQQALQQAAISGNPKFFLGTDSAPHAQDKKETACGCAGCYSAFAAIELYAEAFEALGALDKLEGFASHFGPGFYGLPRNTDTITLVKSEWQAPETLAFGDTDVIPLRAGTKLDWQVA
ncbi:dihydroorotase [Alkalimarinus alittae]|uniref:Dihydroorotase n=1 Tax=Alkalimarinus alittae TaxID=2961619 RepID=A0ABY6MYL2_9ALTE|nr:dihydroorotase [Alkalimarinus alittae]UZE94890.1 dihydroorotase [Alkalimarinus alittae]